MQCSKSDEMGLFDSLVKAKLSGKDTQKDKPNLVEEVKSAADDHVSSGNIREFKVDKDQDSSKSSPSHSQNYDGQYTGKSESVHATPLHAKSTLPIASPSSLFSGFGGLSQDSGSCEVRDLWMETGNTKESSNGVESAKKDFKLFETKVLLTSLRNLVWGKYYRFGGAYFCGRRADVSEVRFDHWFDKHYPLDEEKFAIIEFFNQEDTARANRFAIVECKHIFPYWAKSVDDANKNEKVADKSQWNTTRRDAMRAVS